MSSQSGNNIQQAYDFLKNGEYSSYEVGLKSKEGIVLPCGNSAIYIEK